MLPTAIEQQLGPEFGICYQPHGERFLLRLLCSLGEVIENTGTHIITHAEFGCVRWEEKK
jgi:hypothetical protein